MIELYEKLVEILEVTQVNKEDRLREFENWDSLSVLVVLSHIHEMYNVTINTQEFSTINTVGELEELIKGKKGI